MYDYNPTPRCLAPILLSFRFLLYFLLSAYFFLPSLHHNVRPQTHSLPILCPLQQRGGPDHDSILKTGANRTQVEHWTPEDTPYLKRCEGRNLLEDKKVLITGGDSSISRSVAILMAGEAAHVRFLGLLEEEDAEYSMQEMGKAGRKSLKLSFEIREEEGPCRKIVKDYVKEFARIDVLVNTERWLGL